MLRRGEILTFWRLGRVDSVFVWRALDVSWTECRDGMRIEV